MTSHSNTPLFDALRPEGKQALGVYEDMLRRDSLLLNLTRITSPDAVRLRHFEDAMAGLEPLDAILKDGSHIVDIGSGAGVPGLVLAVARPQWNVVSVEATSKKAEFQERVAKRLGLENFETLDERAEAVGRDAMWRENFDAALARAVAPLNVLAELCLPLLKTGGRLLCWKSRDIDEELQAGRAACEVLGASIKEPLLYSLRDTATDETLEFQIVIIEKHQPTDTRYPRRYNAISKRPLGA